MSEGAMLGNRRHLLPGALPVGPGVVPSDLSVRWIRSDQEGGDAYGFGTQSRRQEAALEALGVEISGDAPIAVHVRSPMAFEPIPGVVNVLNTHWEAPELTPMQRERCLRADAIIVASEWCREVFSRCVPEVPVYLAPLGVDRECRPKRRRLPRAGEPLRWMWLGAWNARKGWEFVLDPEDGAWFRTLPGGWCPAEDTGVELYIKTSFAGAEGELRREGNVIFDDRRLSRADLIDLYYSAHGFVFPSVGEGFGMTLAEAMATGCPSLWTHYGGVTDFAGLFGEGGGYRLPYQMVPFEAEKGFGVDTEIPHPDGTQIAALMLETMAAYKRRAKAADAGGRRVYSRFTWERSALAIVDTLADVMQHREAA